MASVSPIARIHAHTAEYDIAVHGVTGYPPGTCPRIGDP
jgi:hypothetical protein